MAGFIKYMRSEEAEFLLSYPNANHLFCVMAYRARRTDHALNGLKSGQCFLGDYREIGLSEQQYRTAKKQLTNWNLATFKGTNKGTVGTIVNTKVYDINEESSNGLDNRQVTGSQRTGNGRVTTNKECKNDNNEKKVSKAKPSSPQEVQEYFEERGFLDSNFGTSFFNHYEANGWMRGKTKIKDWKACVRTWTTKNQYKLKAKPVPEPEQKINFDDELDLL